MRRPDGSVVIEEQKPYSIPLGSGRVKPEYLEFIRAKSAGEIAQCVTWEQYVTLKAKASGK